jgi:hypothetical protein
VTYLIAACRVWVVGSDLEPLERLDPIGPLAEVPEARRRGITIREYDLEDPFIPREAPYQAGLP